MPKDIPNDWRNLNVAEVFAIRGSYPRDLRIFKNNKSPNIYGRFLPLPEDDPRPNQGRTKSGKRKTVDGSLETQDPYEAAKKAVKWVIERQREFREKLDEQSGRPQKALVNYWDAYFQPECDRRGGDRGYKKWRREEERKWGAPHYGISEQPWAKKPVNAITKKDYQEYFDLLEKRAQKNKGTNGSGIKKEMKTLINKLLELAQDDFQGHAFPKFPTIRTQYQQVTHLRRDQWDALLKTVIDLSGGAAQEQLTLKEYKNLDFPVGNRLNQRNWVDLYDALHLQWFFYFRAEDMGRLRIEWFKKVGTKTVECRLEETKGDREIHKTTHYRPDAVKFWTRLKKRRGNEGWLVTPHISRPSEGGYEKGVLSLLNHLLKHAIKIAKIEMPQSGRSWTTIRHTAFRLTLEEVPELGIPPDINSFATNAHTSAPMLRKTYLNYMDTEKTAEKARAKIKPSEYSLVRNTKNK